MSRIREFEISELARSRESHCPHGQLVLETEKVCEANGLKFLIKDKKCIVLFSTITQPNE